MLACILILQLNLIEFHSELELIFFYFIIASGLNDVSCDAISNFDVLSESKATDLYIFLDTSWQFADIQPTIA